MFTGKEFRTKRKDPNIKLKYRKPYIHTATGLVERGGKTLKDLMRTKLEDNSNLKKALNRPLKVMRTMGHSKIKETPFERHYGRKTCRELTSYLNLQIDTNDTMPAKPDLLQTSSFASNDGNYDQLVKKTPRSLMCDVRNKLPTKFLEKKKDNNNNCLKVNTKLSHKQQ